MYQLHTLFNKLFSSNMYICANSTTTITKFSSGDIINREIFPLKLIVDIQTSFGNGTSSSPEKHSSKDRNRTVLTSDPCAAKVIPNLFEWAKQLASLGSIFCSISSFHTRMLPWSRNLTSESRDGIFVFATLTSRLLWLTMSWLLSSRATFKTRL